MASLQAPVRSPFNGEILKEGSLSRLALENTLLEPTDWHRTLQSAILQLPDTRRVVAFAGFGNHIPPSLVQTLALQVLSLANLDGSKSKRPTESWPVLGLTNGVSVNGSSRSTDWAPPEEQTQEPP